jgi:hypothetical protein
MHMPKSSASEIAETSKQDRKPSRREFARRAALVATTAFVVPATVLSQETSPKPVPPGTSPQTTTGLSADLQAEGELKYRWIIQKYGSRLTDAEKQDVYRLVMEGQKPLAAFRAFPLDNADQPATVLKLSGAEVSGNRSRG